MLDFQAIRLLHRHGDGEYAAMSERAEHSAAAADPERQWKTGNCGLRWAQCSTAVDVTGETPNSTV